MAAVPETENLGGKRQTLPYKLESNWVDGGWCTLGDGTHQRRIRLMLDLGAQRSCGSRSLYDDIAADIRKGNLGAARLAREIKNQVGEGFQGTRQKMDNWVEVAVEAPNVSGVSTIVPATFISLCRVSDVSEEPVVIAGKDLCNALGFLTPKRQRELAHMGAVVDESWLPGVAPARTYVLSADTRERIRANREKQQRTEMVRSQGTMTVGDPAFDGPKLTRWVQEPTMLCSYITSACLASAGSGAKDLGTSYRSSDFSMGRLQPIADWISSCALSRWTSYGCSVNPTRSRDWYVCPSG